VVFSVDEKPQIQALERTAPVLPMPPGVPERRGFDYTRHGTTDPVRRPEHRRRQGHQQAVRPAHGHHRRDLPLLRTDLTTGLLGLLVLTLKLRDRRLSELLRLV
jgi:hypothetical protein